MRAASSGGPGGAGWFKMMEFVEVPSPANGAVGTVAQGNNFDWYRQDVKPGLLNLNLIIDEEVFLGLMADSRLNMAQLPVHDDAPWPIRPQGRHHDRRHGTPERSPIR